MKEEKKILDEWEDESFDILDSFNEKDNSKNKEVIEEAKKKLTDLFNETKDWLEENTKEDKVKENLSRTKEEASHILELTREKVVDISENDNFKNAVQNGKGFLMSTGSLINDGIKAGRKQLEKNDSIKAAFDKADEKIVELKNSEELKKAVDKAEATAMKFGEKVFTGVKRFFNEEDKEEE